VASLKRYQIGIKDKLKCPHMMALQTLPTEKYTKTKNWMPLLASVEHIRGKKFPWSGYTKQRPAGAVIDWIERTPGLKEWVMSDTCLVSPKKWPNAVYKAFRYNLIPSPHEIANVDMNYKYAPTGRVFRNFLVVLLYCMGMSVTQIAKAYETSEAEVHRMMYNAIESLHENPHYLLWASGTDFRRAVIPPFVMRIPMKTRMRFTAAIQSNPFLADHAFADKLIKSPPYFSYLIYGSPKRMRLTKGCRIYRTGEQNGS